MNKKRLAIFGAWQLTGVLVGFGATHVDQFSWTLAALMLMPGTLVDWFFFRQGAIGNSWPLWTFFAIAVAVNTALLSLIVLYRTSWNRSRRNV